MPHKIITHLRKEVGGSGRGTAGDKVQSVQRNPFIEYQACAKLEVGERRCKEHVV